MKHQTQKNQNKDKEKPTPQERNPLQDFNLPLNKVSQPPKSSLQSSSSSESLLSRNPKSSVKCTRNTISTLKANTGLSNLGSRKPPSIVKNASFLKPKMNQPRLRRPNVESPKLKNDERSNLLADLASGSEKSEAKLSCLQKKEVSGDSVNFDAIDNNLNVVSENIKRPKFKNAQRLNLLSDLCLGCEKSEVKLRCVKMEEVSSDSINLDEIDNNLNVICENIKRPKLKNAQRSNLLADFDLGCEKSGVKLRCARMEEISGDSVNLDEIDNNLNGIAENVTPINKLFRGSSLDSAIDEGLNENSNSNNKVKTPPIEPSVSPEIQFGVSSLLVSAVTPGVCYGAGHVLSGVTDKRKCRSRGILTVGDGLNYSLGSGKERSETQCDYSFDGKEDVKVKEFGSLIPFPAEASVKWLLSPCDENSGSPKGESSSKLNNLDGVEGSSPSGFIGSDSDLVCDSSERVCRTLYTPTISGKTYMASPRGFSGFKGFKENHSEKIDGDFLSNRMVVQDKNGFLRSIIEENSPLSIGSLSSGNVMQTPNSDYTSGDNKGGCWLKLSQHGTSKFEPELDPEAQIPGRASSILDPLGLSFQSTDLSSSSSSVELPPLRKNFDNHVSSISVSSVDNMSQSHMRISWRDALASRSSDMDELDCCRCLSDEDISIDELQKLYDGSSRREDGKSTGSACKTPECIEHEIDFPLRKKEKVSPYKPKSCAESISTDGGGLAESEDFD